MILAALSTQIKSMLVVQETTKQCPCCKMVSWAESTAAGHSCICGRGCCLFILHQCIGMWM